MEKSPSEIKSKESLESIQSQVLSIVHQFLSEFKSGRVLQTVTLESSLDRDLGIDSLGRVELFLRIEKQLGLSLSDKAIAETEYIKDIIEALKTAKPSNTKRIPNTFAETLGVTHYDPSRANSILEVLIGHAQASPERPHIYLQGEDASERVITYGEVLASAQKVAKGLYQLGLKRNETVAIMLPTSADFFFAFFGVMLAGGIPVPIYPPVRPDKIEEYSVREATILNNAGVRVLITFSQVETLSKLLKVFIRSLTAVITLDMLMNRGEGAVLPNYKLTPEDAGLIQYTSGSTSDPKGVLLTHGNLLANIRSVGKAANVTNRDVGVTWLPLYHDMGLIGAWFGALYNGFPITVMSPLLFISRPERWLWAIHYHRGTLSAGPNFAYELCIRKIRDEDIQGLDLSSWRLAFNGAEAINPKTLEQFTKKFKPYGFNPASFFPVYGLAECAVALTFPPLNREPKIDIIEREAFEKERKAIPLNSADPNFSAIKKSTPYLEFVCCGKPIPDHDIRIVDEDSLEVGERTVGSLQFCGPSAMHGYFQNPVATHKVYVDGWWDTGDYAYIAEGELYITGRKKDVIIKAGRNLYPQEIEEVTAQVSDVRKGCVVAFGVQDPRVGTETLIIIAETDELETKARDKIINEIIDKVSSVIGIPPDQVILVSPRTIPKTSSGKLQRSQCKKLFEEGKLSKPLLPVWMQVSRIFVKGLGISSQRNLNKVFQVLYTGYAGFVALILFVPLWLGVILFPSKIASKILKFFLYLYVNLLGCPIELKGFSNISPNESYVFICNHSSYIDSLYLLAYLPANVTMVGKKEIQYWPVIGKIFKKLGFLTVDRMDFTKNLSDTDTITQALKNNQSIVLYPEGTFTYAAGLRPFKLGAFKVAVDAGKPICPVSIQGTRKLLRGTEKLLNPTPIKITVSEPLKPNSQEWSEVARLHKEARAEILKNCGEQEIDLVVAGPE